MKNPRSWYPTRAVALVAAVLSGACSATGPDDAAFITSDPAAFAARLVELDNENEVIVVLRDADEPAAAPSRFTRPGITGLIGVPDRDPSQSTRETPFAEASPQSRQAVIESVEAAGGDVYRELSRPIINVRIPDDAVLDVATALLQHPNVDYMEANIGLRGGFDLTR